MTNRLEPPLLDEHDHLHDHSHDGDHHHHDRALNVIEEPLDPASQSLSDALKASFRVLKVIMLVVLVLYVASGAFNVKTDERVIVWILGKQQPPAGPGLHFAPPYPFAEKLRIKTSAKKLQVNSFWLTEAAQEKPIPLNERVARGQSLDPAVDGALLTGDHGIMHMQFTALYEIRRPEDFVQNVSDETGLLKTILENAAIAEAGRSAVDDFLLTGQTQKEDGTVARDPIARGILNRAQEQLDALKTGITLADITIDQSHYPLQTKEAFLDVSTAENKARDSIQGALSEQTKKLNGVAGEAWTALYGLIRRLDQVKSGDERQGILNQIDRVLTEKAQGEAGGKIRLAQSEKHKIIDSTKAEVARFHAYLAEYKKNPELVRQQLRQQALSELFSQNGVKKWFLPAGEKQVMLWINNDPVQAREAEIEAMKAKDKQ